MANHIIKPYSVERAVQAPNNQKEEQKGYQGGSKNREARSGRPIRWRFRAFSAQQTVAWERLNETLNRSDQSVNRNRIDRYDSVRVRVCACFARVVYDGCITDVRRVLWEQPPAKMGKRIGGKEIRKRRNRKPFVRDTFFQLTRVSCNRRFFRR